MNEINKVIKFSDILTKIRNYNFTHGQLLDSVSVSINYYSTNNSLSSDFFFLRELVSERFFDTTSLSSITGLTCIAIPKRYFGLGLSSSPFILSLSSVVFNLSSNVNNYFWSSYRVNSPSEYKIGLLETSPFGALNTNTITAYGYNVNYNLTGTNSSVSSSEYDIFISDRTLYASQSGTLISTLFNAGKKILTLGNDNSSLEFPALITTNSAAGNTRWSSVQNPNYSNSTLTSGITGWTGLTDTGKIIGTLANGVTAVYYHSNTSMTVGVSSAIVVIKTNSNGGKWVHIQDGQIYSTSASGLLFNAMQWLTEDIQQSFIMSDIGLIILPYSTDQYFSSQSLSAIQIGLTACSIVPYNEIELYTTIDSDELKYTTNKTAFLNNNPLSDYLSFIQTDIRYSPMFTKALYLDEDLNVLAVASPSVPIKVHDKLPTTIVTKIIL